MGRRIVQGIGLLFVLAGFLAGLAVLALPWARFKVQAGGQVNVDRDTNAGVFQVHLGGWYLVGLTVTVALLAGAFAGERNWRRPCGGFALLAGLIDAGLAARIGGEADSSAGTAVALGFATVHVHGSAGPGVWYGIIAPILLGLGAAVAALAVRRPSPAGTAPPPTADRETAER